MNLPSLKSHLAHHSSLGAKPEIAKDMQQPDLKISVKTKVLNNKSGDVTSGVPTNYHGVWRRSLLENKQGKDDSSLVLWMQTQHRHVDIRIPALRPNYPQYASLEDFTTNELLMLATQQGFYGITHVQRDICRWQREVDFQPDSGTRDIGEIGFQFDMSGNPNVMLETGIDDDYFEIWHKNKDSHLSPTDKTTTGKNRHGEERTAYMLTAGNQVAFARPRDVVVPASISLLAAIKEHQPSREMLLDWLDCEISFGEKIDNQHWKICYSTHPFREGQTANYA